MIWLIKTCLSLTLGCLLVSFLASPQKISAATQVIQTLPFYDSFDYTPNGLYAASPTVWETWGSTANIYVTNVNLTLPGFVPSAGNSAAGTTKAYRYTGTEFTTQTAVDGKTVFVSFLYQVVAYPTTSPGIVTFLDSTNLGGQPGIIPGTMALALLIDHTGHIGINAGTPTLTGAQFETSVTPVNTTVLVVARYTFHTSPAKDVVDLWVNPTSASYGAGSAPTPDVSVTSAGNIPSLAYFTLSANGNDTTLAQRWDEVRIGTTWAKAVPASNTPNGLSPAHSLMLSASPNTLVADGVSTSIVKMQARDTNGVNLTTGGATVIFTNAIGTMSATTDNGDGTYQATFTAPGSVGTAVISAKLGGITIASAGTATNSAIVTINCTLGPVSAGTSTATASPTNCAADGSTTSTITITALDAQGRGLSGQTVTLGVSGTGNTVSTPANTAANGQTTATLSSTVPGTKTITVTIGSTQITAQPTVTFTSGGVSAFNSTAIASPTGGLTADGMATSTITVTAKDGTGTPLSGQAVTISATGSGNILTQPAATTDVNGLATASIQSTVAGTKTISVNVAGTTISQQPTVTFVAGAATQIAFTVQPVTTPVNVTMPPVVVQIEDQTGNPVAQSGATVNLSINSGTFTGTAPLVTDANGKATFNDLSIHAVSSGLYLTASVSGFSPVQSSVFNVPAKTFYKVNNASALSLAASWATNSGGAGPAGPPASDGLGIWDASSTGGTVDIGGSASWYGMVLNAASGAVTVTDTTGGHTLTLGAGSLDGSAAAHSLTFSNNLALGVDQTWKWTFMSFNLTLAGNVDNGGHTLTIFGQVQGAPVKFFGAITNSGGLILNSNAVVTLAGTNTYSGNTVVNGGKLIINTNGSIAGTAGILLNSNTTLDVSLATPFTIGGSQTLSGNTNGAGTATIAASTSAGAGQVILAPGAQTSFTVNANAISNTATAGSIKVVGGVTLNSNPVTVNITGAPLPEGTYTLLTATNGFVVNGPLPAFTLTGLGLADNAMPQLVINGQNLQLVDGFGVSPAATTNNCGSPVSFTATPAAGTTGYQWYDPSSQPITSATNTTLTLVNPHPADSGIYKVVAIGSTWTMTNSVSLLIVDAAPPVVTLNGSSPVLVSLGSPFMDAGASAYDLCSGDSVAVTTNGSVNTSVAGEYDVTYSATIGNGATNSVTRAVIVFDPAATSPAVTLNLDFGAATDANAGNPITVPTGWTLLPFGDLNQSPNVWGSPTFSNPDGNNPGLTLSFGNISGWSTASSEFTGANGNGVVGISAGGFINYGSKGSGLPATFTLSGVPAGKCVSLYAVDGWDGSGNAPVITFGGQTSTVTAGSFDTAPNIAEFQYVGTAIATNRVVSGSWTGLGGSLTEGQIGGMIIRIQTIPLSSLDIVPSTTMVQCGSNVTFTASAAGLPPIAYQWYDVHGNPIANATNASYTVIDPTDASTGNYTVIAANAYNSLTNTVAINTVYHTALPVMALIGANPVHLITNSAYLDLGATAFDQCAQGYLNVSSNNTVNTAVPGTYTVTYSATTADGTPGNLTRTVIVGTAPYWGTNVVIFDPTMVNIQSQLEAVYAVQKYNQFGPQRTALLFKPGVYTNLEIDLGYYTQALGLGLMPDDATIIGDLRSDGVLQSENATVNFWRGAENLAVVPTNSGNWIIWAVSQGTAFRRMHVLGEVDLANHTDGNFASGGFLADSKVDTTISSIAQQQWLSRNDIFGRWTGGVWNMVFVGVSNPPAGTWPTNVYTIITNTPLESEKPYLYLDTNGNYNVMVPSLQTNTIGTTWANGPTPGTSIPIKQFYIALAGADNAASINAALQEGLNLILTPGVYPLTDSLQVTRPDTVILGLGYPTLIPQTGKAALVVSNVDGVKVGGLLFDAGPVQSPTLFQAGTGASSHPNDPICVYDISMRVGGAANGSTLNCLQIDASDTIGENIWLWRADHGDAVTGWTLNPSVNGLVVNGDRVTIYGLFVEHHEQYQTLWNGNWGRVYFYQSEMPYDVPNQAAWSHDGENGYASYKVTDAVTSHQAYGLGIYGVFINCTNISCFNAIETPANSQQVNLHHMITVYIAGNTANGGSSTMNHIINGTGATVAGPGFGGTATLNNLWNLPTFSIFTGVNAAGTPVTFPTESWHVYQLQYKNSLGDPSWLNLGNALGGNDVQQTVTDPTPGSGRFYRVFYQ
ncbi:MAG TPA: invasin domain 3-containing protein [Candidatus Sulfotelmatobacter sp.]|nr:invasin domain 3-containing protein [Candidatus Sulfotelmatobacter sp.]